MLRRLSTAVNTDTLLQVYYAQIHSVLCYGVVVWGNSSYAGKLFISQKRAIRICCNVPSRTHCKELFINLQVLSFPSLYVLHLLCYAKLNYAKFNGNSDFHTYNTRNKDNLRIQHYHYASSQKNWRYTATRFYNFLPANIKQLELASFKLKIKNILKVECLYKIENFFDIDFTRYL